MSGFGVMLSQDAEESVVRKASELAGSDIKSLLLAQSKAVQHVLAVSSALAQRAEELNAPAARVRSKASSVSSLCQSSDTSGALQSDLEPLLAVRFDPAASYHSANGGQTSPDYPLGAQLQSEARPAPFTTPEDASPPRLASRRLLRAGSDELPMKAQITLQRSQTNLGLDMVAVKSEPRKGGGMFPDVTHVQSFMKETLTKDTYAVENLYKTTGWCQRLARDEWFKNLTFLIIFLNTVWIGYDTDHNRAEVLCNADWVAQFVENAFCTYFSFEVVVRFFAFENKCDAFRNAWFVFDSVLVSLMVWETWITVLMYSLLDSSGGGGGHTSTSLFRMFRLFRLTRVARLGRLINAVPELMLLVRGMAMAVRSVGSTLFLMFLIIYVFSILFTVLLRDSDVGQGKFETVPMSIDHLLVGTVFPDQQYVIQEMLNEHWMYYLFMIVYLLLGSITIMNLLIGILCEVVAVVAEAEKREGNEQDLKDQLIEIMYQIDRNQDSEVNAEELSQIMLFPEAIVLLDDMGVDVYALVANVDFFFQDKETLSIDEFFTQLQLFRHTSMATQKDVLGLRRSLEKEIDSLHKSMKRMLKEQGNVHR